jgi:hypothetical protein
MIPLLKQWQGHYGAAHRKDMTLHPSKGVVLAESGLLLSSAFRSMT